MDGFKLPLQLCFYNRPHNDPSAPLDPEPKSITVEEVISDKNIEQRLRDILAAVGAYEHAEVTSHFLLEEENTLLSQGFRFPDAQREIVFTNQLTLGRGVTA